MAKQINMDTKFDITQMLNRISELKDFCISFPQAATFLLPPASQKYAARVVR